MKTHKQNYKMENFILNVRDENGNWVGIPALKGEAGTAQNAVLYTAQTLTDAQKNQARNNIGAGTSGFSGSYADLTGKPAIPVKLPNPNALTFTGAAQGTYDGSGAMSVHIPYMEKEVVSFTADTQADFPVISRGKIYIMSSGNLTNVPAESIASLINGDEVMIILPYTCTFELTGISIFFRTPACDEPNPSEGYVMYTAVKVGYYFLWDKKKFIQGNW